MKGYDHSKIVNFWTSVTTNSNKPEENVVVQARVNVVILGPGANFFYSDCLSGTLCLMFIHLSALIQSKSCGLSIHLRGNLKSLVIFQGKLGSGLQLRYDPRC